MSDVAVPDSGAHAFDDIIKRAAGSQTETDAMMGELRESRRLQRGIAEKLITDKPPPPPETAAPTPPPPAEKQRSPMEAFGGAASVIGILGGLLSHAPITASLKAATGAMNGYRQRDLETYQQNYQQWQAQSEHAEQLAAWQNARYKQAFEQYKEDHDQLSAALSAIAAADKDTLAAKAIQTGDLRNLGELLQMREGALEKYRTYRLDMDKFAANRSVELQAMDEMRQTNEWLNAPPDQKVQMLEELHKEFQKGTNLTANEIAGKWQVLNDPANNNTPYRYNPITAEATTLNGEPYTPKGAAKIQSGTQPRSAPAMALKRFQEEWQQKHGTEAPAEEILKFGAEYSERIKAARDWGTGPLGNQTRSFNVGIYHLDTLRKLSEALQNGDLLAFNKLGNEWAKQTGQPAPTNFDTAKQIIGAEVVKAIVGAGGGGVQERLEAAQHIASSLSPAQIVGSIDTTQDLMIGQLKGLKQQYKRTTKNDDFEDSFLSPEAKELFDRKEASIGKGSDAAPAQKARLGGRLIEVKDGKWIYTDTGEEVKQ